jgi:hypothetical protein
MLTLRCVELRGLLEFGIFKLLSVDLLFEQLILCIASAGRVDMSSLEQSRKEKR